MSAVSPIADGQPGQICRAQRRRLYAGRAQHSAPNRSLWNCIRKLFADAPPSTRSRVSLRPASLSMARQMSQVWYAIDSNVARIS